MGAFRVLIADDHAVTRAGFRQFLEREPEIEHVGEASSGDETLSKLRAQRWDLVLLDIHMRDRGGLDILSRVRGSYPSVRILIVSGLPEEQYAAIVLRHGAHGYLCKASAPEELMRAVRTVCAGRTYLSEAAALMLLDDLDRRESAPAHTTLSFRELQVFRKLAAGDPIGAIAQELRLSAKTVSTYRAKILEKMAFKTNAEVTRYALQHGLLL